MKEDQKRMPLYEAILEYNEKSPAFFHIPGHRYERGINETWRAKVGDEIFKFDLSETPLTDDLHHASGPIKEAEQLAAELSATRLWWSPRLTEAPRSPFPATPTNPC